MVTPQALAEKIRAYNRVAVHLGNVGLEMEPEPGAGKTSSYAKRFPGTLFVGIDTRLQLPSHGIANWVQIQADFHNGLRRLADASVDLISSEFALGHYDASSRQRASENYDRRTLEIAAAKLKSGGKLHVCSDHYTIARLAEYAGEMQSYSKVTVTNLEEKAAGRTYWMTEISNYAPQVTIPLYQLTAVRTAKKPG